jgi:hypothetical protein
VRGNNLILPGTDTGQVDRVMEGIHPYTDIWVYKSGKRPKSISLEKMLYLWRGERLSPTFSQCRYPISKACPPSLSSSTSCNDTIRSRMVTMIRRPSGVVVKSVLRGEGHCGWGMSQTLGRTIFQRFRERNSGSTQGQIGLCVCPENPTSA